MLFRRLIGSALLACLALGQHQAAAEEPVTSSVVTGAGAGLRAQPAVQLLSAEDEDSIAAFSTSQHLASHAREYLGVRYRFGGVSPSTGLDCSGLVLNVFRHAIGLQLPRTAREMSRLGEEIRRDQLQPGDLVFFNTLNRAYSHVGIYLGSDEFVHAPSSGGKVRIEKLSTRYWATRFNGGRRLIDEDHEQTALVSSPADAGGS